MVDTVLLAEHDWRDKEKEERYTKKKKKKRKSQKVNLSSAWRRRIEVV